MGDEMTLWHAVKWDDMLKGFEKTTKGDEMKKPRVIKGKNEAVGEEREGRYWVWNGPHDNDPYLGPKNADDVFSYGFTYQEYQGEVPEYPRDKTDGEKLAQLLEVADAVATGFWAGEKYLRLKDLVKELKETT